MLVWTGSLNRPVKSCLFLDRDGVLNHDRPDYVKSWGEIVFYPDALEALRWLRERAIAAVLVSNQSGLGRGIIRWSDFWHLHERMVGTIRDAGGDLTAAFFCPHRPDEGCSCRKPAPGMILAAARLLSIPLESCFMVGDRPTDLEAMANAGGRAVLLVRGFPEHSLDEAVPGHPPVARHGSLMEVVASLPWPDRI